VRGGGVRFANRENRMTPEQMDADARAALAIDRAQGVPIPDGEDYADAYLIGFGQGAQWVIDQVRAQGGRS